MRGVIIIGSGIDTNELG